jgi:nicotinamidase-related amidase
LTEVILELPIRWFQIARLYGPGMPASGREGYHQRILRKPAGRLGLVSVHCWNVGEPNGPYPIGTDAHCPGKAADWVPTAREIIRERIAPVMDAARRAGVTVFHLAQSTCARKYPQYREIAEDPELKPPSDTADFKRCVRPRPVEGQWSDEYGEAFPGPVWETHEHEFDIAEPARPTDDEPVVTDGWQLNGLCRRRDIDTLLYVGFMADLCLINIPGGIREMSGKFGYRCVVLRDCTTAYEFEDTHEGRWMTRAAVRLIETGLGYSTTSDDFIAACTRRGDDDAVV